MTEAKTCYKCGELKPLGAFHRLTRSKDGRQSICKLCKQKENKAYFDARPGLAAAQAVKWKTETPDAKNRQRSYVAKQMERDREKVLARKMLRHAVKAGRIIRQPCEHCGATPTEGHHEDHSKPLKVIWLCRPCHIALHKARGDRMKRYE
jgi:protein-arginine kinase activator protein McsA